MLNGSISRWGLVRNGVAQGSALELVLLNMFTNDTDMRLSVSSAGFQMMS